jgi:hypothetical protein
VPAWPIILFLLLSFPPSENIFKRGRDRHSKACSSERVDTRFASTAWGMYRHARPQVSFGIPQHSSLVCDYWGGGRAVRVGDDLGRDAAGMLHLNPHHYHM